MPPPPDFTTLLAELTAVPGISGHEDAIAALMRDRLRQRAESVTVDSLCNVVARFGPADAERRVAVVAHLDTVGLMVKQVNGDSTLSITPVGGVNFKALPAAAVRVGDRPGVIGVRSQHLAQPGDTTPANAEDLYIEVGAGVDVEITTPITYAPATIRMASGLYASPYLDDRAGCAVLLALAEALQPPENHAIYLVGSAQEETTCAGAYHALAGIRPHAALFVDGTVSYDTPDTRGRGPVALGQGPVFLSHLYVSGLNGWHAHPRLREHLKLVARASGIPYQQDAVRGLMSDARVATWLGIPSVVVGVPMRGKHAPLETIHLDDLQATFQLILEFLNRPLPDLSRG